MTVPFVHLRVHTEYSLMTAMEKCSDIAKKCKEYGMPYCAVTDRDTMSGCFEFYTAMRKEGLKPILGTEMVVFFSDIQWNKKPVQEHIVCLAETYEGYLNLCHIYEEGGVNSDCKSPLIDLELLRKYSKGLICITDNLEGGIASLSLRKLDKGAEEIVLALRDLFGENNFFLGLQDHGEKAEREVNAKVIALAHKHNLPLVATNDCRFLTREDAKAQELFSRIRIQLPLHEEWQAGVNPEHYFKNPEEMEALFKDIPEALENTVKIAERCCNVHIPTVSEDKVNHYPEFSLPEDYKGTCEEYLLDLCRKGMKERYNIDIDAKVFTPEQQGIVDRMRYELDVIGQRGYASYYLIIWDILQFARVDGIPVGPGRGSSTGSLVAYLLHITDIDPIRYNLLFERFFNPERAIPPDIDIDVCERRRKRIIEYIQDRYGKENVAQIAVFRPFGALDLVKDVAHTLGLPASGVKRLCKLIPDDPKMRLELAKRWVPELAGFLDTEPWAQEVWHYSMALEGLNRSRSTHMTGIVISDTRLSNVCPVEKGENDELMTQYPGGLASEELGLLKLDFVGLKILTVIQNTLDQIYMKHGIRLRFNEIPNDDEKTYKLLNRGDTTGVFQLESSGIQNLCKKFGINCLEDISALIAIYRPGPLQFLEEFIERKSGKTKVEYDVPAMEPILKETYGIMLYQEQVMQVLHVIGGFSLCEADIVRRLAVWRSYQENAMMFARFAEGAKMHGYPEEKVKQVWNTIGKFVGYAFNKAHSVSYALLTYRTAYLKANYPDEYLLMLKKSGNAWY